MPPQAKAHRPSSEQKAEEGSSLGQGAGCPGSGIQEHLGAFGAAASSRRVLQNQRVIWLGWGLGAVSHTTPMVPGSRDECFWPAPVHGASVVSQSPPLPWVLGGEEEEEKAAWPPWEPSSSSSSRPSPPSSLCPQLCSLSKVPGRREAWL